MTQEQFDKAQELSREISNLAKLLSSLEGIIEGRKIESMTYYMERPHIGYPFGHQYIGKELAEYLKPYFEAKLQKYKKELEQL